MKLQAVITVAGKIEIWGQKNTGIVKYTWLYLEAYIFVVLTRMCVTTENADVIVTLPAVWDFFWFAKIRLHVECFLKMM